MVRRRGLGVRLRLALSYAGFLLIAGVVLLAAVWVFLLRYVPEGAIPVSDAFVPNRSDLTAAFAPAAVAALVFLLVFGLVGGWFLAGRVLAPLTRIAEVVRLASDGSLEHRIRLPGRADELSELADAFDTMLSQLAQQLAEQQRFAANASHQLRTPLAITRTLLEVAAEDPARDSAELVERLTAVNGRAIELTEALLMLSRADRGAFAPEPVDLSLVAEEAAETMLALAERNGVSIEVRGEAVWTPGSSALLLQLVLNLVHNAVVHNLAAGGSVLVTTGMVADRAELRVESTGEALTSELVATLTEPFVRARGRTGGGDGGVGLGLAIVSSIVRAHRGGMVLEPRSGGGLLVTVGLPVLR